MRHNIQVFWTQLCNECTLRAGAFTANVRAGDRRQHGGRRLARHNFGRGAFAVVLRKCAQRRRAGKTKRNIDLSVNPHNSPSSRGKPVRGRWTRFYCRITSRRYVHQRRKTDVYLLQMGFLLGEALEFIVKTYTDSDNQVETVKIHISEYNRSDISAFFV